MKKTLTINLNGTVFHIDEDAYEVLHHYLEQLRLQFAHEEDGQEILDDIEARISELFTERLRYGMQVVRLLDVHDVIGVMGQPEQIAHAQETFAEIPFAAHVEEPKAAPTGGEDLPPMPKKGVKRLMRSVEDRVLAGVCGGLGQYTGIDAWVFRLGFVLCFLLAYGMPLIIYGVLWIVLPEGLTVAQKLQMRGEEPTVENIKQAIQEGELSAADTQPKRSGWGILLKLLLALAAIFLLPLFLVLLLLVFALITAFLPFFYWGDHFTLSPMVGDLLPLQYISHPLSFTLALMTVIILPLYALVYALMWRAKRVEPISKTMAWVLGAIWTIAAWVLTYEIWF